MKNNKHIFTGILTATILGMSFSAWATTPPEKTDAQYRAELREKNPKLSEIEINRRVEAHHRFLELMAETPIRLKEYSFDSESIRKIEPKVSYSKIWRTHIPLLSSPEAQRAHAKMSFHSFRDLSKGSGGSSVRASLERQIPDSVLSLSEKLKKLSPEKSSEFRGIVRETMIAFDKKFLGDTSVRVGALKELISQDLSGTLVTLVEEKDAKHGLLDRRSHISPAAYIASMDLGRELNATLNNQIAVVNQYRSMINEKKPDGLGYFESQMKNPPQRTIPSAETFDRAFLAVYESRTGKHLESEERAKYLASLKMASELEKGCLVDLSDGRNP